MNHIPVFLPADNNYAYYLAVVMKSILSNTKGEVDFYVLDGGITNENKKKILSVNAGCNIEFLSVDIEKCFKNFHTGLHLNKAIYMRFLAPFLKPNLDKILYIDTDTIILQDIEALYKTDLQDFPLGAIWEEYGENRYNQEYKKRLNLSRDHKYFNAGVLLINADRWRKMDIFNQVCNIEREKSDVLTMLDQDILNIIFDNNYKTLAREFNWINQNYDFFGQPKEPIVIRHFNGTVKPWQIHPDIKKNAKLAFTIDKDEFWKYAQMTSFYDELLSNVKYKTSQDMQKFLVHSLLKGRLNYGEVK